jgi:hypothetical protein
MTQDEIIAMAIQAELNLYVNDLTEKRYIEVIEAFAKLVAAKEREACAKVCDKTFFSIHSAQAIRARGEA